MLRARSFSIPAFGGYLMRLYLLPIILPKTYGANLPSPMLDHSLTVQRIVAIAFIGSCLPHPMARLR